MLPRRCAGIGPRAGTKSFPYFFRSCPRTYACKDSYSGFSCSHSRSASFASSSGGMSYIDRHSAPASAKPSSREPLFPSSTIRAYRCRIGPPTTCHPIHARLNSSGSRLDAIKADTAVIQAFPLLSVGAPLPFSLVSVQRSQHLRQLFLLLRICRSRKFRGQFQEQHLSRHQGRKLHAVEVVRLFRHLGGKRAQFLVGLRGDLLRILRNEILLNPRRSLCLVRQIEVAAFRRVKEFLRLRLRRWIFPS